MTDLIRLAERVSTAASGSRELDALIECEVRRQKAYALGLSDKVRSHWKPIGDKGEVIDHQGITRYHAPAYTFSVDAAMALVPESYTWTLSTIGTENFTFWCSVAFPDEEAGSDQARSATPALALTAAAILSLAAQRGQG